MSSSPTEVGFLTKVWEFKEASVPELSRLSQKLRCGGMHAKKNACRLSGVNIKKLLFTAYSAGVLSEDHGHGKHHGVKEIIQLWATRTFPSSWPRMHNNKMGYYCPGHIYRWRKTCTAKQGKLPKPFPPIVYSVTSKDKEPSMKFAVLAGMWRNAPPSPLPTSWVNGSRRIFMAANENED